MLGGILLTSDVLEQAALGEHQLVAPIDLENLKLDTIAKRYYDDFTDIARILVMDAEHVFPKDKLPAEVHAELHETEPLSSKTSMDFKRALQAYLGQFNSCIFIIVLCPWGSKSITPLIRLARAYFSSHEVQKLG